MQYNFKDRKGEVFGRLTVSELDINNPNNGTYWICICKCGNTKSVRTDHLRTGKTVSCGCYMVECTTDRNTTHGHTKGDNKSLEYRAWRSMKQRCHSESYHAKERYSERGIKICQRWEDSFENFLEDMGKKPSKKHTLERKDNDLGYYKENCEWAVIGIQAKNRSNNVWLEYNGRKMIVSDWANVLNVSVSTICEHLQKKSFLELIDYYKVKYNLSV